MRDKKFQYPRLKWATTGPHFSPPPPLLRHLISRAYQHLCTMVMAADWMVEGASATSPGHQSSTFLLLVLL